MLDFVIFAIVLVVGLLGLVFYLYPGSRQRPSTVPGDDPSDDKQGNLPDISQAGSLHQYLLGLHEKYGDIASFWWGTQYVVSVASGAILKKQSHLFDRPVEQFMLFEPLIGRKCLQYANGSDGRMRRQLYERSFVHDRIKKYHEVFLQCGHEVAKKWTSLADGHQHIPLGQYMLALALKSASEALFGGYFKNQEEILEFKKAYEWCWEYLENTMKCVAGGDKETEAKQFEFYRAKMYTMIGNAMESRKKNPPSSPQEHVFLDDLLETDLLTDDVKLLDALIFAVGSFHTTGNLMTWCLYYISAHPDVQEKLHDELKTVLKNDSDDLSPDETSELPYMKQVIHETLRCATIAPWAARFSSQDSHLGGHLIPKNTPVIHALGCLSMRGEWSGGDPEVFDPDNFTAEKVRSRPPNDFLPFGGPGKRICPGQRFTYGEAYTFLSVLLRKFTFKLVPGQLVEKEYGLVTHPKEEIWVTLEKRTS